VTAITQSLMEQFQEADHRLAEAKEGLAKCKRSRLIPELRARVYYATQKRDKLRRKLRKAEEPDKLAAKKPGEIEQTQAKLAAIKGRATIAYEGSDAVLTRRTLRDLEGKGHHGRIAAALFRAQKASSRAKRYTLHGPE
jgi:hypothetical protein